MGLFRKKTSGPAATTPVARGSCSCPEHLEELMGLVVPFAPWIGMEDAEPMTVGELVEMSALGVDPADLVWVDDQESGDRRGPFHFRLWVGDEARAMYDDDAAVQLDEALLQQPGVEVVDWEDREVLHVGAPTLCADGVLAAAARALLDPRVKQ
jgi:hypothetical protein